MVALCTLRSRRNEWLKDFNGSFVMIDSDGWLHRVSPVWLSRRSVEKAWAISWTNADDEAPTIPGANVGQGLHDSAEEAMAWVDSGLADHFTWFERDAA